MHWDLIMMLLIVYVVFVIPYTIAFNIDTVSKPRYRVSQPWYRVI